MTILSGGNVGIGESSPTAKLQVTSASTTYDAAWIENTAGSNYGRCLRFNLGNDFDDTSSYFVYATGGDSSLKAVIYSNGDILNDNDVYGAISDERTKQDIHDANSQWDDIKALKVRNFKRKDDVYKYGDDAWEQIGVVAQEVEEVSPKPTPSSSWADDDDDDIDSFFG